MPKGKKKVTILKGFHAVYPSQPLFEKIGKKYTKTVNLHRLLPYDRTGGYECKNLKITIEEL